MVKWLIQSNIKESRFKDLTEQLERLKCNFQLIKMFAFTNAFYSNDVLSLNFEEAPTLDIPANENIVIMGSVGTSRLGKDLGIFPGGFLTDNSDFGVWSKAYGLENILNYDAVQGKMFELEIPKNGDFFVRPVKDDKTFSGLISNYDSFTSWIDKLKQFEEGECRLNKDTEIIISGLKQIYSEYRFFIVDGKIVTYSMYKQGNTVIHKQDENLEVYNFAQKMVDRWNPIDAYVLDIADTSNGPKVIEINAFGSSGFYACDIQKIILAIEEKYV